MSNRYSIVVGVGLHDNLPETPVALLHFADDHVLAEFQLDTDQVTDSIALDVQVNLINEWGAVQLVKASRPTPT
ncbi:hypothetical protein [Levilactobacillus sp. N40-8-2]|uniref:hypothetical protein n=1 Tax=Levilactobacillus muriae TaxID=3238987 RepID=UPI0038B32675